MKTTVTIMTLLCMGLFVPIYAQSPHQLTVCAETGDLQCMLSLASRMIDPSDSMHDPPSALIWYERAAQSQDTMAHILLAAYLTYIGPKEKQDHERAWEILQPYRNADIPQAYFLMGHMRQFGLVGTPKKKEALELYFAAASHGFSPALYSIGYLIFKGEGTDQNYADATTFFKAAYELGDRNGAYMLAECYRNGYGVLQDMDRAIELYRFAVQEGQPAAQQILREAQDLAANLTPDWIDPQLSAEEAAVLTALEIQPTCQTDLHSLVGEWQGKLLIQDFACTKVMESIPITFEAVVEDHLYGMKIEKEPLRCRLQDYRQELLYIDLQELNDIWGGCRTAGYKSIPIDFNSPNPTDKSSWHHIYDIQWIAEGLASLTFQGDTYFAIRYRTYDGIKSERDYFVTLVLKHTANTSDFAAWIAQRDQEIKKAQSLKPSISPNPIQQAQSLDLTYHLYRPAHVRIHLLDINGNILQVLKDEEVLRFGPQTFKADVSQAGNQFFIRIATDEQVASVHVVR